jgi:hypothetical protein
LTARVAMLIKSRPSPDMLPFSLSNKKILAVRYMNRSLYFGKQVGLRIYQHPLIMLSKCISLHTNLPELLLHSVNEKQIVHIICASQYRVCSVTKLNFSKRHSKVLLILKHEIGNKALLISSIASFTSHSVEPFYL